MPFDLRPIRGEGDCRHDEGRHADGGQHGMAATDRGWLSGAPSQPLYRLMIQLHWKLPAMARINILESVKLMSAQGFINWIYSLHRPKEPRDV